MYLRTQQIKVSLPWRYRRCCRYMMELVPWIPRSRGMTRDAWHYQRLWKVPALCIGWPRKNDPPPKHSAINLKIFITGICSSALFRFNIFWTWCLNFRDEGVNPLALPPNWCPRICLLSNLISYKRFTKEGLKNWRVHRPIGREA